MTTFNDALLIARKDLQAKLAAIDALLEAPTKQPVETPAKLGRKPMSAAAKKAHSQRMKAYWTRRRAEGNKKAPATRKG